MQQPSPPHQTLPWTQGLVFGKLVESIGEDEVVLPDFAVQEVPQLLGTTLYWPLDEHLEHGVYAFQRQGVQVGEHPNNVRPEHLNKTKEHLLPSAKLSGKNKNKKTWQ